MFDIIFFGSTEKSWKQFKSKYPAAKRASSLPDAKRKCFTKFFWAVFDDLEVCEDFDFSYVPDKLSQDVVHVFRNRNHFDGVCLIPKSNLPTEKELEYRFFTQKKEVDTQASVPLPYDVFEIETYEEYEYALEYSSTEMFWMSSPNIKINQELVDTFYFSHHNTQDRSQNHAFIHEVDGEKYYNGLFLCSKQQPLTKREVEYRFPVNRREWDLTGSTSVSYDVFEVNNYDEYKHALEHSSTEMFWLVPSDVTINNNFDFDFYFNVDNEYDRHINHVFLNGDTYDGVILCSKHAPISQKEIEHRFLVNKKEHEVKASTPKPYDLFEIETYEEYEYALENSTTEMFWMSSANIKVNDDLVNNFYFSHHNTQDRSQNHAFIHEVNNEKYYNGLFLCSKKQPLTKREVEYRFPVNRREWDLAGSTKIQYPKVSINTYEEYKKACETVSTELFWAIPDDVDVVDTFDFDWYFTHDNEYDRHINHSLLNGKYNDGILLCSKNAKISKKEFDYGFVINKKEHDTLASNPKPFDIVFISYDEPNADQNFEKLKSRFPSTKRVNGVKGIHNAHIEAAKKVETEMFWVVDADSIVVEEFNFDYQVPKWQRDTVHVWSSRNPVNGLTYGYGGVKLLPTSMTIHMDKRKTDMTTSISDKYKQIEEMSNITAFNTDAFSAWRSAFRECVKLSSRIINRQVDSETKQRLETWCNVGTNARFGIETIAGAKAGKEFGKKCKDNPEVLNNINNFDWLYDEFQRKE